MTPVTEEQIVNEYTRRLTALKSEVMIAKANLCDSQHQLQGAQGRVEECQRALMIAEVKLHGAEQMLAPVEQPKE